MIFHNIYYATNSEYDIRINPHFVLKRAHPKVKELRARAKAEQEAKAAEEARTAPYKGDLFSPTLQTQDKSVYMSDEERAARKAAGRDYLATHFPNGVAVAFEEKMGAQQSANR